MIHQFDKQIEKDYLCIILSLKYLLWATVDSLNTCALIKLFQPIGSHRGVAIKY